MRHRPLVYLTRVLRTGYPHDDTYRLPEELTAIVFLQLKNSDECTHKLFAAFF
jgi:hypothetical protein